MIGVPFLPASITRRPVLWGLLAVLALAGLIAVIAIARANKQQNAVLRAAPETILGDPELRRIAIAGGKPVYEKYCQSCHGAEGRGSQPFGVPDLTDDDHLYGTGEVAQIEDIARFGIRAHNKRGWNLAVMPAYASSVPDKAEPLPPQTPGQIEDLTQFLLTFTARATDDAAALRGRETYEKAGCWDCHGHDAGGDSSIGAPTLTDNVWLYGGSHDDIRRTIAYGRAGISPAFRKVLTPAQLRDVAVYVASLAPPSPSIPND